MLAIASWIGIGVAIGLAGSTVAPQSFPTGRAGAALAGAAGAFVGGGGLALVLERGAARLSLPTVVAAAVTAVLVLAVARRANYAQPRPQ
jgi:uncharacterized membrane protein YeaQ/YmgE (transglycosylase-associated protein family)